MTKHTPYWFGVIKKAITRKNKGEDADLCRKLIEGVAKYAVDAALNKGSRSRN